MTSDATSAQLRQALAETLLVDTDAEFGAVAFDCSDRSGGGLVLAGSQALATAEYLLSHKGYSRPLLVNRRRYAGNRRTYAQQAFDANWISRQRRLNLVGIMPDAGFVAADDESGLVSILTRTKDLGENAIAPLGLAVSWLDAQRGLPMLIDHVLAAGVPIAIALEHQKDPLGVRYVLNGLVTLLSSCPDVIVLDCDVSAIGTLCFGAMSAAVGTRTGLRHIYPVSNGGGGEAKIAAVVLDCLAYVSLDKIDQAVQADPDNQLWVCSCLRCNGNTLQALGSAPDPEQAAYHHSLETLYRIRDDILGNDSSPALRRQSWIAQCDSALFQFMDIDETTYKWEPPPALGNWTSQRNHLLMERPWR